MILFKLLFFQLYLLQLENYDLPRYWRGFARLVMARPKRLAPRQKLVWTAKARLILILSITLAVIPALAYDNLLVTVILWLFFVNLLAPVFLSLAVIILAPADYAAKQIVISRARRKLAGLKNLKIIGITGSFGKTTMKETLAAVLGEKFKVLKTPENINTPVGIARLIRDQLDDSIQIFLVEMGAYKKGDIRALCRLAPPDIAVLTGINEAHLERFGSLANTVEAKFEIVKFSQPRALAVLNEDSELIKTNFARYLGGRSALWYKKAAEMPLGAVPAVLGSYISGMAEAAVLIGRQLGLADEEIRRGLNKLRPVPHRLQKIENPNGITVIDDSYNGNPAGAAEAIRVLGQFAGRRKIYITPGLVEMGERSEAVHKKIGEQLTGVADLLILIKNSATPHIAEAYQGQVLWFDSAPAAHAALAGILRGGDVVLFQNDWPDNYA